MIATKSSSKRRTTLRCQSSLRAGLPGMDPGSCHLANAVCGPRTEYQFVSSDSGMFYSQQESCFQRVTFNGVVVFMLHC